MYYPVKNGCFLSLLVASFTPFMGHAEDVTLTIESWRSDDLIVWQDAILPVFEATHPGIKVSFTPTAPAEYDAVLNSRLSSGTAGDLITCRPFDASLELYLKGRLMDITNLNGMENFTDYAKTGWSTDDNKIQYCVPMASVIHGFIYNKVIFNDLGLSEPETVDEFYTLLDAIKADGKYIPMAIGASDQWEAATMGYQNIGPNYWKGEEGRLALIDGKQKLTDTPWVEPYRQLQKWMDYLGPGFESQSYSDSQNLFTLGQAAIYPAGSWEIRLFSQTALFEMGAFKPPVQNKGDTCYISDHVDIGLGINTTTSHPKEAQIFLEWLTSKEFAQLYMDKLPGFATLSTHMIKTHDPLGNEFLSWRDECAPTIRSTYQTLSRGIPNLENETWNAAAAVLRNKRTPEEVAQKLQADLASWYAPQKDE